MLVHEGQARSARADRRLAFCLAGVAGALNPAGFYAVGLYASNMTGNVSAVAERIGSGDLALAVIPVVLIGVFVLGAFVSTLLVNMGRRRHLNGIYAYSILFEALLLIGWGCLDLLIPLIARGPLLVFGLSFLLGLQNATVTQISKARVRTTHVTGMVTDIGMELANLFDVRRGSAPSDLYDAIKLNLHLVTVSSFLLGGLLGVTMLRRFGTAPLLFFAAAILVALAVPVIRASWLDRTVPVRATPD